jgi:hypothetical protein
VRKLGSREFGSAASPYLTPYLYNKRFLYRQYSIKKEGNVFKIGDSTLTLDEQSNIHITGKEIKGTVGLWVFLTRNKVDKKKIATAELKNYKPKLDMTHAHLEGYEPSGSIQISNGPKYCDFIVKLFSHERRRGVESELRRRWMTYYETR